MQPNYFAGQPVGQPQMAPHGAHTTDAEFKRYKIEFQAGGFSHNGRVSALLLPCTLPIIALCGKLTLTILLSGLVASYIFDYLNYRNWTLISFWLTMCCVWLALFLGHVAIVFQSWFNIFILMNTSWFIMICGVWGTVQFRWFQKYTPEGALLAERVLICMAPMVVLPLFFSTVVGVGGVINSAFYMVAITCGCHHMFFTPLKSSWKVSLVAVANRDEQTQGNRECMLYSFVCLVLPVAIHYCVHHRILTFSVGDLLNFCALVALPLYYLFFNPRQTMWWCFPPNFNSLPREEQAKHPLVKTHKLVLLVCHVICIHWFETRLLHSRYGHLLLGIPPPYNKLALLGALYCGSLMLVLIWQLVKMSERHSQGMFVASRWIGVLFLSVVSALLFAVVLGMKSFMAPFPVLAAACFVAYCLDRNNFNNFLMFTCCTTITLLWWMAKSFSFIDIEMPIIYDTQYLSLHAAGLLIIVLFVVTCALFPTSFYAHPDHSEGRILLTVVLFAHANLFTFVEHVLYSQTEAFYSTSLVFITSALGAVMAKKLHQNGKLTIGQSGLITGCYLTKLYMFFVFSTTSELILDSVADDDMATLEAIVLYIAVLVSCCIFCLLQFESAEKKKRTRPTMAILYFFSSLLTMWLSRHSVLAAFLQLSSGSYVHDWSTSRLLGMVIFSWGLLQLPVSLQYMRHITSYRRLNIVLLVAGAVVGLLEPALAIFEDAPEAVDEAVYLYRAPWWVGWTGVLGAILVAVIAVVPQLRYPQQTVLRAAVQIPATVLLGLTFTASFIPYPDWHVYLFMATMFVLTGLVIDQSHFPVKQNVYMPCVIMYITQLVTTFVCYIVVTRADHSHISGVLYVLVELSEVTHSSFISVVAALNLFLAVLLKAKLTGTPLLRAAGNVSGLTVVQPKAMLALGLVNNLAVLVSFFSLCIFNIYYNESSPAVFLGLSCILLLLHKDPYLFSDFNVDKQQYVPPLIFVETLLSMVAVAQLYGTAFAGGVIKELLLYLCGLPSHLIIWRFINTWNTPRAAQGCVGLILSVICMSYTTLPALKWLGFAGFVGIGMAFFTHTLWSKQRETLL